MNANPKIQQDYSLRSATRRTSALYKSRSSCETASDDVVTGNATLCTMIMIYVRKEIKSDYVDDMVREASRPSRENQKSPREQPSPAQLCRPYKLHAKIFIDLLSHADDLASRGRNLISDQKPLYVVVITKCSLQI